MAIRPMGNPVKRQNPLPSSNSGNDVGYLVLFLLLMVFVAAGCVLAAWTASNLGWRTPSLGNDALIIAYSALLNGVLVVLPMRTWIAREKRENDEREAAILADADRQEFEGRLHRALRSGDNEQDILDVLQRAMAMAAEELPFELLLADSSRAHLNVAVSGGPHGVGPGCPVDSPFNCTAVKNGQTMLFDDPQALDACPKLRNRASGDCSAVCVPINIMGNAIGVLHATGMAGSTPLPGIVQGLETIASQAGSRLTLLRAMEQSQLQAATDPLTGLLNRRSFESRVATLLSSGRPLALALADLDNFKRLNDTFGHDTGDRSLRQFSRTLVETLRPLDIVARYGGEEFVIVLPDCDARSAVGVLETCRVALALAQADGSVPPFTASFGVVDTTQADDLNELLRLADGALFVAKGSGRDRIERATATPSSALAGPPPPARPEVPQAELVAERR
jgi:diguanylate cyclase (GGDEF)-like protein